jgi:NADPH2:quinone reductase
MKACILKETGDVSNFSITETKDPIEIGETEVLIKHTAISINFDDIMYRKGLYKINTADNKLNNFILGLDGVGIIQKKGEKVKGFTAGQQVGYGFCNFGSYVGSRVIDYRYLIDIPQDIPSDIACACMRRGLTAEYLLFKCTRLNKDDWILIHSIAGGLGTILAKWAKFSGLKVIGTIGDESKLSIALSTGCDFVINRKTEKLYDKVKEYTNGEGVRALFDGIGQSVFEDSMSVIKPFGVYVSLGYASGMIDNVNIMQLRKKSLFFTAPTLDLYKSSRYELILSGAQDISMIKRGVISPNITRYGIDGIPQAHNDLESGKTTGSIVITMF